MRKMCLGVPTKVIQIEGNKAIVDYMGVQKKIDISLLKNVSVGNYILVHAGVAIDKMDTEEYNEFNNLFEELKDAVSED
ncbi:HypC/HybG/HupF family hydrogenase formation chaperone [Caldicellulosiruptoraceae bacterium PP1]